MGHLSERQLPANSSAYKSHQPYSQGGNVQGYQSGASEAGIIAQHGQNFQNFQIAQQDYTATQDAPSYSSQTIQDNVQSAQASYGAAQQGYVQGQPGTQMGIAPGQSTAGQGPQSYSSSQNAYAYGGQQPSSAQGAQALQSGYSPGVGQGLAQQSVPRVNRQGYRGRQAVGQIPLGGQASSDGQPGASAAGPRQAYSQQHVSVIAHLKNLQHYTTTGFSGTGDHVTPQKSHKVNCSHLKAVD